MNTKDHESATVQSDDLQRKKRVKLFSCIAIFIVFQIIVFTVLGLTVLRVKSPKININSIGIQRSNNGPNSFNMTLIVQVSIKNKNFGEYKFDNTPMVFAYRDVKIGETMIPRMKIKARGTRQFNVVLDVNSDQVSGNRNLSSDLDSGALMLSSSARMRGKVRLIYMIKKHKSGEMNCTMNVNTMRPIGHQISCK